MLWRAVCVMTGHVCRKSVPQRRKNWKSRAKRGQPTDVGLPTGRGGYGKTLAETMLACGLRFACCRISNSGVAIRSTERNRGSFYGISMCGRGQRKVPVCLNGSRAVLYLPDVPRRRVCLRRKLARQLPLYDLAAAGRVRTGSAPRFRSINPCGAGIRPAPVSGEAIRTARSCTALPHPRHLHHRRKPRLADSALCPAQHLCGRHCIPYYPCCCVNGGCCTSRLCIN